MKVLGIPVTFGDDIIKRVFYDKAQNINEDMRVPLLTTFNTSNLYIPIDTDFTERVYIYEYYEISDIM